MIMARISAPQIDRLSLPFASLAAAASALFMLIVWAPLQVRSLDEALNPAQEQKTAGHANWLYAPFATADGTTTSIAASNGQVRIVTMIYTHCPGMCPLAIQTLKRIELSLPANRRPRLGVIAITLDPAQDSLVALREFRRARQIDSVHWTLGRPSADSVAQIASSLGVSFRILDDHTVDHQGVFVLLDKDGSVLARTSRTQDVEPEFLAAVRAALQS
jgi:protein SCO1